MNDQHMSGRCPVSRCRNRYKRCQVPLGCVAGCGYYRTCYGCTMHPWAASEINYSGIGPQDITSAQQRRYLNSGVSRGEDSHDHKCQVSNSGSGSESDHQRDDFPFEVVNEALRRAVTFTELVIGTQLVVLERFAVGGDSNFTRLFGSEIQNEGWQAIANQQPARPPGSEDFWARGATERWISADTRRRCQSPSVSHSSAPAI
jgi:hypothetical protein